MFPSASLVIRTLRRSPLSRLKASFSLYPTHNWPESKSTLETAVVGAGTLLDWKKPLPQGVAQYLLKILQPAAEVKRVFTGLCLKDCKDVTRGISILEVRGWRRWLEGVGYRGKRWSPA